MEEQPQLLVSEGQRTKGMLTALKRKIRSAGHEELCCVSLKLASGGGVKGRSRMSTG